MTQHEDSESGAKRQRIAKLMARAGLCSRRDAEAWIVDGRVSVNGTIITSPALDVDDEDAILVDGDPIPAADKTRLFLFHKPRGLVTSDHDPEGRATVADYLREHWPDGPRVVTIGRLDINTEGLLLLTNDGGLARMLELPQTGWVRRYRVRAKGEANPATLDALAAGVTIDGIDYAGIEAKLDRVQGANCWLTMGLREGKNREIKRVLEHIGLEVNRLIRLSFGPFQLLELPEGAVEEVRTRVLRDQLGENLAKQAGVDFGDSAPIKAPQREVRAHRKEESRPAREARKSDGPTAGRGRPPERGARLPPSGRPARPRRDDREDRDETPPAVRERPIAGARKHVSTLRAVESQDARKGPRKRIERTDTQDRRDRTIKVERLVSTRPAASTRRPRVNASDPKARDPNTRFPRGDAPLKRDGSDDRRGAARRPERTERGEGRREPRREERHETRRDAGPAAPRRHASPSALGKRERMERSGAAPNRVREREPGASRDDAPRPDAGGKVRSRRPPPDDGGRPAARSERAQIPRPGAERGPRPGAERGPRPDRSPRSGASERAPRPSGERGARPNAERAPRRERSDRDEGRRPDTVRKSRPAGERPDARKETRRDDRPPRAGRPMGAASRKPGGRKPPPGGAPRGSPTGAPRGKPPRGPSKPKR